MFEFKGRLQQREQVDCKRTRLALEKRAKAQPEFSLKIQNLQESAGRERARASVRPRPLTIIERHPCLPLWKGSSWPRHQCLPHLCGLEVGPSQIPAAPSRPNGVPAVSAVVSYLHVPSGPTAHRGGLPLFSVTSECVSRCPSSSDSPPSRVSLSAFSQGAAQGPLAHTLQPTGQGHYQLWRQPCALWEWKEAGG